MKKISGFTILELLVTIAIAGILVSIGLPAFNSSIGKSRLTSNTNAMVGAMSYARSEAINRATNVIVKPFASGGWEVAVVSGGEQLRLIQLATQDITITTDPSNLAGITFSASGYRSQPASEATLEFCNTALETGRLITVSVGGSTKTEEITSC